MADTGNHHGTQSLPAQTELHYPSQRTASTKQMNLISHAYLDSQPKNSPRDSEPAVCVGMTLRLTKPCHEGERNTTEEEGESGREGLTEESR